MSWDPAADPEAVERVGRSLGAAVSWDRPLGPLTTLKVGGAARVFVEVADADALGTVLTALAAEPGVPLLVVGRGSNLLVSDAGFGGVAVRLGAGFKWLRRNGNIVSAGAAEAMPALAAWAGREGLAGLEFAAGVPASVGGSVRMNAGAHGGDVAARLVEAVVAAPEFPAGKAFGADELGFGYRTSALPERSVVTAASFRLDPDDAVAVRARLDELRAWRRRVQPIGERTCGSVFTNPDGDSAGRLVEAAGLKGFAVGGARVSPLHANFIEAAPGASAADVHALIRHMQEAVVASGGPLLEPEVREVGRF
jgi:UDP-N-acetylmuramate dehydrogenase